MVLDVEEIGALQVLIAVGVAGVDAVGSLESAHEPSIFSEMWIAPRNERNCPRTFVTMR
jgi:hypothetical protein